MAAALRTRGQAAATSAIPAFAGGGGPHAVLLVGPPSVGKTTFALDLAAAMLCTAPDPADRPCGACRGCRHVASGNHPDLHRLAPDGPGGQIRIGDQRDPEPGTVRWLLHELALIPLEGRLRVAILEHADRLNEPAQQALLKTLEEPPGAVTIILCADDEDRLLPTVRSRCARVRLGPLAVRDIEDLLGELALADPPTAARLARVSAGRPGLAVAYATTPEAATIRGEVARALLDLLSVGPAARLRSIRELHSRAIEAAKALAEATGEAAGVSPGRRDRGAQLDATASGRAEDGTVGRDEGGAAPATPLEDEPPEGPVPLTARRSTMERRRAAAWLLDVWRDLSRDLAVLELGDQRAVRDIGLLDELEAVIPRLEPGAAAGFLHRLLRTGEQLDSNVSPELALDVLVLRWPRARAVA